MGDEDMTTPSEATSPAEETPAESVSESAGDAESAPSEGEGQA